jgi:hypothetical protein
MRSSVHRLSQFSLSSSSSSSSSSLFKSPGFIYLIRPSSSTTTTVSTFLGTSTRCNSHSPAYTNRSISTASSTFNLSFASRSFSTKMSSSSETPSSTHFDYLVIGGGSGGLGSGRRAASYGARVGIVEFQRLGGTCVNVGCVPKKVMFNTAMIAEHLHDAKEYGFEKIGESAEDFQVSWAKLKEKRDAYVKRLNGIYENNLVKDNVTYIQGTGSFVDKSTVEVNGTKYTAKHVSQHIICTWKSLVNLFFLL